MSRKLLRGALAACLCVYVSINGLGCGSSDSAAPASTPAETDTVIYEGGTTDEALDSIIGVTATVDDTRAGELSSPASSASVPPEPALTFSWSAGTASLGAPTRRSRAWNPFEGERVAHAHGQPVTGVVYYLVLSTPKTPKLAELLTTKTTWQPDQTTWAKIVAAGEPITATLTTARVEQNRLAADGGPFVRSKAVVFTVSK